MNRWAAIALIVACLTLSLVLIRAAQTMLVAPFVAALAKTDAPASWASIVRNVGGFARFVTAQDGPVPSRSFAGFAGDWGRHGYHLTIEPDGTAIVEWRTYMQCDAPGATRPCDTGVEPGGHARMRFDRAVGDTLYGTVVETNAPTAMLTPPYPVALERRPDGTALLFVGDAATLSPAERGGSYAATLCGSAEAWASGMCGA